MGTRGHPANQERQLALLTGEPHYEGKRCRACNGTMRYAGSGSCVACTKASSVRASKRKVTNKRRRERARELREEADLAELLGETSTEGEPARGLHAENETLLASEPIDESPKSRQCTPCTPRIAHGDDSNRPGVIHDTTGIIHRIEKGNSGVTPVLYDDPAAQTMAYAACSDENPNKPKLRYFCHPESGSIFTTTGEEPENDGFVEEISEDAYADLKAAGFTEPPVNSSDDLDDILG